MHLFLLGVSHRTAPVDLRERLDFSSRDLGAAVEALATRPSAAESVVLSTCNRSEIYVASSDPTRAREELVDFLSHYHELPRDAFLPHLFAYDDAEAARHLFRVAAGLDSLVVGEPQILGQVKDAFQVAAQRQATGPLLGKVFDWAFGVGKRVRTETTLGTETWPEPIAVRERTSFAVWSARESVRCSTAPTVPARRATSYASFTWPRICGSPSTSESSDDATPNRCLTAPPPVSA